MAVSALSLNPLAAKSGTASTTTAATTTSSSAASQLAATENRFLALLVAQMKNQDPLNPLDNAQVTSQMAQLSTVQGVNQTNAQLTQLLSEFQGLQAMTLAGRSVLVPGNVLSVPSTGTVEARGGFETASDATSVRVTVKSPTGQVVRTIDLGARAAGIGSFRWDGLDDAGKPVAAGDYSFSVTAANGTQSVSSRALSAVRVEGVNRGASGIQLDLGRLGTVGFADVLQVL